MHSTAKPHILPPSWAPTPQHPVLDSVALTIPPGPWRAIEGVEKEFGVKLHFLGHVLSAKRKLGWKVEVRGSPEACRGVIEDIKRIAFNPNFSDHASAHEEEAQQPVSASDKEWMKSMVTIYGEDLIGDLMGLVARRESWSAEWESILGGPLDRIQKGREDDATLEKPKTPQLLQDLEEGGKIAPRTSRRGPGGNVIDGRQVINHVHLGFEAGKNQRNPLSGYDGKKDSCLHSYQNITLTYVPGLKLALNTNQSSGNWVDAGA
uniref:Uncharacterized protein n=1 Tax=Chromera velia CCMP2878 TaxID=1169474 RepID=A0A0G4H8M7_9ALVE|eukprot:Cvel_25223.t1-p1 / transcript=Cvel_25223.t1 / gene=Cvel_25223 / organism=Chromera_velia_CCMP2878 / gene_product=hypothetical protein / transcript_product=hypothetical protein / location=Cvel_scaffold2828:4433-7606(-) / protein_length=262 / sequence_SO=supercontig / SO=protein_coding / is_pseudo=false